MKKIYTSLLSALVSLLIAQPTSTLVLANYYGGNAKTIFADNSNQKLYYYTQFP